MEKIFIITGTRKGIGKQLAEHYLQLGHFVAGCSRGKSSIDHINYSHYILDVSNERKILKMVKSVKNKFGHIDVLLNNAGTAAMNHILTTPYKDGLFTG